MNRNIFIGCLMLFISVLLTITDIFFPAINYISSEKYNFIGIIFIAGFTFFGCSLILIGLEAQKDE